MDSSEIQSYVLVAEDEHADAMELPTESDGAILLSTVQAQFPGALGLKYKSPSGNAWRGVRLASNVLDPPTGGWGDTIFVVTMPKSDAVKRKLDDGGNREPDAKLIKTTTNLSLDPSYNDLIVLGLNYKATDNDMKAYFQQFGEVTMCEIKKEPGSNKSRGFGFVRFADDEVAKAVMKQTHVIMGRRAEVKFPKQREQFPTKLFVGRLPAELSEPDLREYFSTFGDLTDVYVPKPHRGFGFISFRDGEVAQRVLNVNHSLKGHRLNVTHAEPKGGKEKDKGVASGGGPPMPNAVGNKVPQEKTFDFDDMIKIFSNARGISNFAAYLATHAGKGPAGGPAHHHGAGGSGGAGPMDFGSGSTGSGVGYGGAGPGNFGNYGGYGY